MPTADQWGQGVQIASLTDAPDANRLAADLAAGLIPRSNMRFASAAERAAYLGNTPAEGTEVVLADDRQKYIYLNGTWRRVATDRAMESTTSGASATSGWSLSEWFGKRASGWCSARFAVQRTGPIIEASSVGNIEDIQIGTIPAGWRPIEGIVEAQACDGYGEGGAQILSSGQVWLRTWSTNGSLRPERTVRIYASYLLP